MQSDDQRPRLVGPGRGVQQDLALALRRVDGQHVVARRRRRTGRRRGLRCVVDRLRSRLPGDERNEREGGHEGTGRPRVASGHAGTARAKAQSRQSTQVRIATGPAGGRAARSARLHRRPRREAAEELPGPPCGRKRRRQRLGPRAARPAAGPAVEADVLDPRRGAAVAPGDLGHPGRELQPVDLPVAAVDAPPPPQQPPRAGLEVARRAAARGRPARRCRGSRAPAAGARACTAAASDRRRPPTPRLRGARTDRTPAAPSAPRRSTRR